MAVLTRGAAGALPVVGARMRGRHLPFAVVVGVAAVLRGVAVVAYRGVLWFPDAHSYLTVAVHPVPYPARPMGYAFFLRLLEPLHGFVVVAAVQHGMGLAAGVLVYATLRRFRVRGWVAVLCAAPVLFDAYQLELEHLMLSDTLFWFLVLVAVVLVLWWPDRWPAMAGAGLVLGAATLTRSVGLPLLVVFAGYLLVRRRPRAALTAAAGCLLPMAAYAVWFHATWGTYALTNSDGIFLYGRTAAFADCRVVHPPATERDLCPRRPPAERPASPNYIWHDGPLGGIPNWDKFTPAANAWAGDFARRAILAQPGAYLTTGLGDLAKTFAPGRMPYPRRYDVDLYDFPARVPAQRLGSHPVPGRTLGAAIRTYTADPHATGRATMSPGAAAFLRGYQKVVYLPGPVLALIVAGGGITLLVRAARTRGTPCHGQDSRRRSSPRAAAALPWLTAVTLLVVPPFTASFDYRYVVPAVPLACLALGLAVTRTGAGSASPSAAAVR